MDKKTFGFLLFLAVIAKGHCQNAWTLNCEFCDVTNPNFYTCLMIDPIIPNYTPNDTFTIDGSHTNNRSNSDVWAAEISFGNIPVIVREFFTTFTNLLEFRVRNSVLETLTRGDFEHASSLRRLELSGNLLTAIPADAFLGAMSIGILNFYNNNIETIEVGAFNGLSFCYDVLLSNNSIQVLEPDVLAPLTYLRVIIVDDNQITTMHANLLQNNTILNYFSANQNAIASIAPSIFESVPQLSNVQLRNNSCVDREWRSIGTISTWEQLHEELEDCFNNYDGSGNETRTFMLELTGTLIIRDQNGQELLRLHA